jgi:valyl-tRNA synthetase
MEKEIAKLQKEVDRSAKKLANKKFVANAPEKVVNAEKQKAVEWQEKLAAAKDRLASLKNA